MPYVGALGVPMVPAWKEAMTVDCTWLSGELLDGLICSPASRILIYFRMAPLIHQLSILNYYVLEPGFFVSPSVTSRVLLVSGGLHMTPDISRWLLDL